MKITIGHLYPLTMNTYGDTGNIVCLMQRCAWRGIEVEVQEIEVGQEIPDGIDLYFFGGGQDLAQNAVAADLGTKANRLAQDVTAGIPLLAVCGGYQLLGSGYQPAEGSALPGIGIFPVQTTASTSRMIGNLVITANPELGLSALPTLVGFENHSGKTTFTSPEAKALGTVMHGYGNNGSDKTEGCVSHNAIGCYVHGPLLPKNPHLADWLIARALARHQPTTTLNPLDDALELSAHAAIVGRYT